MSVCFFYFFFFIVRSLPIGESIGKELRETLREWKFRKKLWMDVGRAGGEGEQIFRHKSPTIPLLLN